MTRPSWPPSRGAVLRPRGADARHPEKKPTVFLVRGAFLLKQRGFRRFWKLCEKWGKL